MWVVKVRLPVGESTTVSVWLWVAVRVPVRVDVGTMDCVGVWLAVALVSDGDLDVLPGLQVAETVAVGTLLKDRVGVVVGLAVGVWVWLKEGLVRDGLPVSHRVPVEVPVSDRETGVSVVGVEVKDRDLVRLCEAVPEMVVLCVGVAVGGGGEGDGVTELEPAETEENEGVGVTEHEGGERVGLRVGGERVGVRLSGDAV